MSGRKSSKLSGEIRRYLPPTHHRYDGGLLSRNETGSALGRGVRLSFQALRSHRGALAHPESRCACDAWSVCLQIIETAPRGNRLPSGLQIARDDRGGKRCSSGSSSRIACRRRPWPAVSPRFPAIPSQVIRGWQALEPARRSHLTPPPDVRPSTPSRSPRMTPGGEIDAVCEFYQPFNEPVEVRDDFAQQPGGRKRGTDAAQMGDWQCGGVCVSMASTSRRNRKILVAPSEIRNHDRQF